MKKDRDSDGTIERAIALLFSVARKGHEIPIAEQAAALGIPLSTAYRTVATLARHGLLAQGARGHFGPGLDLIALGEAADRRTVLRHAARMPLRRLARSMKATTHLGILDGDMVTYLVKERGGGQLLFTREDGELEAYCSAIGKVLLSTCPRPRLDEYLAAGPFIALTDRTTTDPDAIRTEIERVAVLGFAIDDREIADDLHCTAVPVHDREGRTVAAISLSQHMDAPLASDLVRQLRMCAETIERRLGRNAG